jgi:hypothetical protein
MSLSHEYDIYFSCLLCWLQANPCYVVPTEYIIISLVYTFSHTDLRLANMESKSVKKGPHTDAWFKNFSFVIKQENSHWGLPFSFNMFSKNIFKTRKGEFHFKCLVTFFTCWILIYSSHYIHVIYWRSKDQLKKYAFCFCVTFIDLIIYVIASVIFLDMHQFCRVFNTFLEYGREYNRTAYTSLAHYLIIWKWYY